MHGRQQKRKETSDGVGDGIFERYLFAGVAWFDKALAIWVGAEEVDAKIVVRGNSFT
jgi:hypothetical protein